MKNGVCLTIPTQSFFAGWRFKPQSWHISPFQETFFFIYAEDWPPIIRVLYVRLILISLVWTDQKLDLDVLGSFFFDLPISLTVRKQISKLYVYEIRLKNKKNKQQRSSQFWRVFTKTIPFWPLRLSAQVFQIKWTKQCFFI